MKSFRVDEVFVKSVQNDLIQNVIEIISPLWEVELGRFTRSYLCGSDLSDLQSLSISHNINKSYESVLVSVGITQLVVL